MASRSVILQKKLHELESELADIIRLPPDPTPYGPRLQMAFDDVKKRFIFLNNLLLQEMASQPQNSEQLLEIGQRLAALQSDFRHWNERRLSICSECTEALLLHAAARETDSPIPETGNPYCDKSPEKFTTEESLKKKDCTQMVPYDEARESGSDSISDSDDFFDEKFSSHDKFFISTSEKDENVRKEEVVVAAAVAAATMEDEKVWSKMGKLGGAFGCGMIVGAICMVKLFSAISSHHLVEYEALLLPPT
ncbi:hypothetical protein OROGR_011221 [Orobanche gracilis]